MGLHRTKSVPHLFFRHWVLDFGGFHVEGSPQTQPCVELRALLLSELVLFYFTRHLPIAFLCVIITCSR